MSDWIEKYRPFKISDVSQDRILIREAPLLLMDIDVNSNLGKILIGHRSGKKEKIDLISGNSLIENWVRSKFLADPELLLNIKNNEGSFVDVFKQYLKIYIGLKRSNLLLSPNTRKRLNNKRLSEVKVTEFIAWAKSKKLEINDKIKAAYPDDDSQNPPNKPTSSATDDQTKEGSKDQDECGLPLNVKLTDKKDAADKKNQEESELIKKFLESVKITHPTATSKDIINHCFKCYVEPRNTRKIEMIKDIIKKLGITMDSSSGKCSNTSNDLMKGAPTFNQP